MDDALRRALALAGRQHGVVTRTQALGLGFDDSRATRFVNDARWQRVHPGVFVVHAGPLPWQARALAALAYAGEGALLGHDAAAHLLRFTSRAPSVIDVIIPADRRVAPQPGLRLRRSVTAARGHRAAVLRLVTTSAVRTAIDLAAAARRTDDVIGHLSRAVRAGVAVDALRAEALARRTLRGRGLLLEMLAAAEAGIESPLELRYHRDVERAHGLPTSRLQRRDVIGGMWLRADVVLEGLGVRVELDGRLAHPDSHRGRDAWRDNAVGIARRELTLRYHWEHVAGDPCLTAEQVVEALRSRGWRGAPRPCGPICLLRR